MSDVNNTERVAFVTCAEPNKTGSEALLMAESLRRCGGTFGSSRIIAYNPRGLGPLRSEIADGFQQLDVEVRDDIVNDRYREYGPANKPFVAAIAEQTLDEDYIVIVDSDSLFLRPPAALHLQTLDSAAVVPVWLPGVGSCGDADPAERFWRAACEECGITRVVKALMPSLGTDGVRFYFNSGLVAVRREAGILQRWRECFETLASSRRILGMLEVSDPAAHVSPRFFLDQIALAVALSASHEQVAILGREYNCPLHQYIVAGRRQVTINTVIHFHYNNALHNREFVERWIGDPDGLAGAPSWLLERLPVSPVEMGGPSQQEIRDAFSRAFSLWRKELEDR